jgi:3-oxoacyl-[acyl-carrier protein] reductase
MLLKNKNAVVTGCNKGIGKKILEVFCENQATVFACVRNTSKDFLKYTEELEKKYHNKIFIINLDLDNEINLKKAAEEINLKNKPIDILVNNAATIHTGLFQMTPIKKLKEVFEIDFFSQSLFTQLILKSMMKNKSGSIIHISSSSALDGNEGRSAYLTAKAALIAQAKVLSREVGHYNIRVNSIAPGLTNTDMMTKNTDEQMIDKIKTITSLKRVGEPHEIANVVLFLASEMSSYVTGQVIRVDGGM